MYDKNQNNELNEKSSNAVADPGSGMKEACGAFGTDLRAAECPRDASDMYRDFRLHTKISGLISLGWLYTPVERGFLFLEILSS